MDKNSYTRASYDILNKVFRDGAFSSQTLYRALEDTENSELVHKIVMGVLDRNVELEYAISRFAQKPVKPAVALVLKQGLYCLKYLQGVPDYAVVNNHVELAKTLGKSALAGFVNAVLKRAAKEGLPMPDDSDKILYLSVKSSKPEWLVKKCIDDFGYDAAENILCADSYDLTHIRVNTLKYNDAQFKNFMAEKGIEYMISEAGGYLVKLNRDLKKLFSDGLITYQSIASMLAVAALNLKKEQSLIDVCAAPGGKSVYAAEILTGGRVFACDIYAHRVELINSYARRMGAKNIISTLSDATVFNPDFSEAFDAVLADVPCSALGIVRKEPDILLNRKAEDILSLQRLQRKILENICKYVRKGGVLVYSTCTYTKEENIDNIKYFLSQNPNFKLEKIPVERANNGTLQLLPAGAIDGFFIARMVRYE